MGLFFKKSNTNTSSDWVTAKSVWVKNASAVWTPVKKIFVKALSGWVQFWPKSGPTTTTPPYFSTDTAGNTQPSNSSTFTLPVKTTCYLQKGTWDGNGGTISSYSYQIAISNNSTIGTTKTNTSDSGSMINYASISLTDTTYDGQYIIGTVTATRTDSVTGVDSTDSNNFRYFVMRKYAPTEYSAGSPLVSVSPTVTTTTKTGGLLYSSSSPYTFSYSNQWNGTSDYLPDSSRSSIKWYYSSNQYGSASAIIANATQITTGITTQSPTNSGGIYSVSSTLSMSTITQGLYIYAVDTQQNSNTDYNGITSNSQKFAYAGPIYDSPQPTVQPTLTATTPSGYGGKTNSFTVGATVTGNTGTWSPTPNGPYPVSSSFQYSLTSSITNQGNWNIINVPAIEGNFQDLTQNQNHSFILNSLFYTPPLGGASTVSAGNYLEYSVAVENASNAGVSSFYTNSQLIYPVPTATGAPIFTITASNQALVYWAQGLYSSYSYQLQYSADGSTNWTNTGSIVYTNPSSSSQILYTGLPSGYQYYRVLAYNADGVWIASSSTYYWSNPPTYTFNIGNTLYVGTNGYIAFDTASTSLNITTTVGKVFGFLPADLVQDSISYASLINGGTNYWLILWKGHRFGNSNTNEIIVEFLFQDGVQYGWAKYTFGGTISGTITSSTPGFYYNGVAITSQTGISNGSLVGFRWDTSGNAVSIPNSIGYPFGNSWAGWISSTGVTSGTTDDGYVTETTFAASFPSAPQNVTNSSVTGTTATVSWSSPSSNGGSNIQYYTYSLNGAAEVNIGNVTSQNFINLNPGTQYTVSIRAYNYGGVTGNNNNIGSTTFTTTAQYTVTWNANGGSVTPSSSTVYNGSSVTAPTPTLSRYTFNGWYTAPSGGTLVISAGGTYYPSATITLYAQWTLIQYTISFSSNAYYGTNVFIGSTTVQGSTTGPVGTVVTFGTPGAISGYTFLGWRDSPNIFSYIYQFSAGQTWTIGQSGTTNMTFWPWYTQNLPVPSTPTATIDHGQGATTSPYTATRFGGFTWSSTNATSYNVVIYRSGTGNPSFTGGSTGTGNNFSVFANLPGTTSTSYTVPQNGYYYLTVVGVNSSGSSNNGTPIAFFNTGYDWIY
jgi:uncharacterized repeat protein (TIGR02543 family)